MLGMADTKKMSPAMKETVARATARLREIQAVCDEGKMLAAMVDAGVRTAGFVEPLPSIFSVDVDALSPGMLTYIFPIPMRLITWSVVEGVDAFSVRSARAGRMQALISSEEIPASELVGNLPFNIAVPQDGESLAAGCPGSVEVYNTSKKRARFAISVRGFELSAPRRAQ
jgi:hypothetical protein